jgi:hypothetical protein
MVIIKEAPHFLFESKIFFLNQKLAKPGAEIEANTVSFITVVN